MKTETLEIETVPVNAVFDSLDRKILREIVRNCGFRSLIDNAPL